MAGRQIWIGIERCSNVFIFHQFVLWGQTRKRSTKSTSSILKHRAYNSGWKRERGTGTWKSFLIILFSVVLYYLQCCVMCNALHLFHIHQQLPEWKEESMEKVSNGIEKSYESSCNMFKTVPALLLYLGLIHFNIIFILFATFFLSLSKALLFVLFSSSLL